MNKNTPVISIMTKKVVVANLSNKFSQIKKLFMDFNLHHLPVTDGNDKVIGIISYHDVLRAYHEFGQRKKVFDDKILDNEIKVADVMVKNPDTIGPMESIKKAAELFSRNKYHALLVLQDDKIKGIVTSNDLIKFVLES